MAIEGKIKGALKKGARKLHTDEVAYKRADNGGIHARVERHTKEGGHHHTEHHVLADFDDAQKHFQENMGDQPAAGDQPPQQQTEPDPQMAAAGAAGAQGGDGGGGGAAMPGM